MSGSLLKPLIAASGPKPRNGDDAKSVVSERGGKASALNADFYEALQVIETPGHLKSYFTLPKLARSGLSVYGVGDIALPLGDIQARQIMGQGERYDIASCPWKLDPTQFKLDYSVWEGRLKAVYRNIAPGLGHGQDWIDSVRAKPSALLLMEKRAIPYHMDLVYRGDGAGHILVYLPSADLQGGEIVAKAGGQKKTVFSPNKTEENFASWLSMSQPEPVRSGCALVIIFSFIPIKGTISGSALFWRDETRAVRHTLKRWLTKDAGSRERNALYHPLLGDYMKSKLCLNELGLQDDGRVQVLQRISDNFGFKLYLGHIERDQKKLENSNDYEDIEGRIRITKLLNLDGRLVTENLPLDNTHVPEAFFECITWKYSKEDPSSLTRKWSLTRKGHMSFFVIVPFDSIVSFFVQRGSGDNNLSGREHFPGLLGDYARMCMSGQPSKSTLSVFEELCELVWDHPRNRSEEDTQSPFQTQKPEFQNSDLIDVLKATILLKRYSWFEKIAAAHKGSLSTSFFGWIPQTFHKSTVPIDKWFGPLEKGENEIDPESKPDAFLGFMVAIDNFGRYDHISLQKSQELYRKASRAFIMSAAFRQMHGKEKDVSNEPDFISRPGDFDFGETARGNPMEHDESDSDYDEYMMDSDQDFLDDYMPGARNYMPGGIDSDMDLDEPDMDPFGYHVHHHNHNDYEAYKAYQEYELNGGKPETEVVESQVQSATLGSWLEQVMDTSTKYDDIFSLALAKIGAVAPQIPSADFHTLWLPALRHIAPRMARRSLERAKDPNTLLWRQNISALIKAYLDNYVGKWPRRPSLAQKGVGCGCADCKGLNVFLADASLKSGRFIASKKRCNHLMKITRKDEADVYVERKQIKGNSQEQKLVVTKSRSKMLTRARAAWKERQDEATKQLGAFEQKDLATLMEPEWMTLFSMAHLGGPSLSDMDMRKALRLKTGRHDIPVEIAYMNPSTIAMFFTGLDPMEENLLYL